MINWYKHLKGSAAVRLKESSIPWGKAMWMEKVKGRQVLNLRLLGCHPCCWRTGKAVLARQQEMLYPVPVEPTNHSLH